MGVEVKRVVCCDFDGTITTEDTFVSMIQHFAPELSTQLLPEIYALRLTLRDGVRQMLESIPSECYPEILNFAKTRSMREGLVEFLDFLDAEGIPFVVISSGLRGMVETVLDQLKERVHAIHAVDLDTTGTYLRVLSDFEEGTELVSKVKAMQQYSADQLVAIGDSVTDLNMALAAPTIFARDRLAQYLDERHKGYIPWNNFFDIRDQLAQLWGLEP